MPILPGGTHWHYRETIAVVAGGEPEASLPRREDAGESGVSPARSLEFTKSRPPKAYPMSKRRKGQATACMAVYSNTPPMKLF